MMLYVENPKNSTQKLIGLINEVSRVAGSKVADIINMQKLAAFL